MKVAVGGITRIETRLSPFGASHVSCATIASPASPLPIVTSTPAVDSVIEIGARRPAFQVRFSFACGQRRSEEPFPPAPLDA